VGDQCPTFAVRGEPKKTIEHFIQVCNIVDELIILLVEAVQWAARVMKYFVLLPYKSYHVLAL